LFSDVRTAQRCKWVGVTRIAAVLADLPHWPQEIKKTCPLIGGMPDVGRKARVYSAFLELLESMFPYRTEVREIALVAGTGRGSFCSQRIYRFT